jgi:hypothetical protein
LPRRELVVKELCRVLDGLWQLAIIPDLLGFPMQSRMWTLNRLGYRYIPCDLFGAHTPKLGA